MEKIYLDNSSTSYPKAVGVGQAMCDFINSNCFNINRGGYEGSYEVSNAVIDTRDLIANFFNAPKTKNVIFTNNITQSLNVVLKGFLKYNDHVIISSMEHNAVVRPLGQLKDKGVSYDIAFCDSRGNLEISDLKAKIKKNTRAVVMTHASNICGTILPIREVGSICKEYGIAFIVDSAQTAGILPIDMKECNIDVLTFTGHKGLLGPQGIGGFIVNDKIAKEIDPMVAGGTGSLSHSEFMPEILPDKFEAGTLNLPGIIGLNIAMQYIGDYGIQNIFNKERLLATRFIKGIEGLKGIKKVGNDNLENSCAIVSLDFENLDNGEVSYLLDSEYGIMTRCGLHCSPLAHKTLNTYPKGIVRFSFGHLNTTEEVDKAVLAVQNISKGI